MTKDTKQSVSHFTEEQLTPLEQKFADAKANRDAGVEPYKIVPVELWKDILFSLEKSEELYSEFQHVSPKVYSIIRNALKSARQL